MKLINCTIPLIAILISGCSLSRDILNPPVGIPGKFRNSPTAADTIQIVKLDWKTFYPDEDLRALIDTALVRNYDMQTALNRLEASRLIYKQSKWNNVPQLSLNITGSYNRPSKNSLSSLSLQQFGAGNHIEDYNANLGFSWEADIWGKIKNQSKKALASFLQTEEAKKTIQTDLIAQVARAYYNLLMFDEQLNVARQNAKLADRTLEVITLQYKSGQVTQLAVQQTQALKDQATQLVPAFEQNILLQENALKVLMGQLPERVERHKTLMAFDFKRPFSTGIPSETLRARPDVKGAEFALMASNAEVGIATANLYPSLRITASGGVNALKAEDWFKLPSSLFGTVAGNLVQPLLNQRKLKTDLKLAVIQREQSVIAFRQQVLNATGEISDALASIEKLAEQAQIASSRVNTLQQATKNADMLFKSGMANYLEVISAQESVLRGELDLATLKKAQLTAYSDLYRALGGGWK